MSATTTAAHRPWAGIIASYADRLPVETRWAAVTLAEGATPLLPAPRLSELTGCAVALKVEGLNPDPLMDWGSCAGVAVDGCFWR